MSQEQLIARIYEAAVVPDLRPTLLNDIAAVGGCFGGILFTVAHNNQVMRWTSCEAAAEFMSAFVAVPEFQADNLRLKSGLAARHHGFLSNDLMYSRDDMAKSLVYQEFYFPRGLGWCAGAVVPAPNGDLAAFSLERRYSDGPVPRDALARLDQLWPHLARASALATRLNLQRARAIVDTLARAGMPAAILGRGTRLLAANPLFENMTPQIIFAAHDRLRFANVGAQAVLEDALAATADARASRPIAVPAHNEKPPAALHLLPLSGEGRDVFAQAETLVIVTRLDRAGAPSAELLMGLFDLTASEARVAREVSEGKSIDEAAAVLGLSRETVRFYLKIVFAKTGVNRQADLVALLAGSSLPGAMA